MVSAKEQQEEWEFGQKKISLFEKKQQNLTHKTVLKLPRINMARIDTNLGVRTNQEIIQSSNEYGNTLFIGK